MLRKCNIFVINDATNCKTLQYQAIQQNCKTLITLTKPLFYDII